MLFHAAVGRTGSVSVIGSPSISMTDLKPYKVFMIKNVLDEESKAVN
jgi:hypothetical protein